MVFLILIPLNIDLLQQESTLTIKDKNSTSAFQLAEAGLDRGYWKLKENNNYWSMIGNGYRLAGYTFDLAYSDIPSTGPASAGYYCVEITTHPTNNRKRIIRSIGIDKDRKETRALQAIYEVQGIDSAIFSDAGIDVGGNVEVHWGPVRSYQTIDAGSRKYPRMYSKQLVVDWDASYGPPTAGGDAVGVPPAQWFWWTEYDVPSRAQINFNAYRSSSIALGRYSYGDNNHTNGGTIEFPNIAETNGWTYFYESTGTNPTGENVADGTQMCRGKAIKMPHGHNGNVRVAGGSTYIIGNVIVMGDMQTSGTAGGGNYVYTLSESIKEEIPKEYVAINTSAANEFPADAGTTINNTFEWDSSGPSPYPVDGNQYGMKRGVTFRGFVYVNGNLDSQGNIVIHGSILVKGTVSGMGTVKVFYNDSLDVETLTTSFSRKEWKEYVAVFPTGLLP
ncbi:MAG: hypothetical protein A2252_10620 [Elusimicrobia bacterium RIFOXYA2_FULL_39_19]|nr:MAG: hypothetical protein A2252_10620 [Elusimicrobia bacterium RIFOXYA2_FULL_39_19]